jgi:hypothetical protein
MTEEAHDAPQTLVAHAYAVAPPDLRPPHHLRSEFRDRSVYLYPLLMGWFCHSPLMTGLLSRQFMAQR